MKTNDLTQDIQSLPVDVRAHMDDSMLRTLNQPVPARDKKWTDLASQRLREIQAGKVKPVPVAEVFNEIRRRFN